MKNKASVCISIDCELAWGVVDNLSNKFIKTLELDEIICNELIQLFNDLDISVTWAVVGYADKNNKMKNIVDKKAWYNPKL